MSRVAALALLLLALPGAAEDRLSPSAPDGIRPGGSLGETLPAPVIAAPERDAIRPARAFPMLPPVVPHHVRDHQVDLNANRCLACHSEERSAEMQAPAVSLSHFETRDGEQRPQVTGARYFCLLCHAPQHQVAPLVTNDYRPGEIPDAAPVDH